MEESAGASNLIYTDTAIYLNKYTVRAEDGRCFGTS